MRYLQNVLIINLLIISQFSFSQRLSVEERRNNIIKIINEEIKEVDKLQRKYKGRNPSLYFRKSELFLEKARVLKEIENEKYLALSVNERRRTKKSRYFKNSRNHFYQAKKISLYLLKNFKSYKHSADVYYILGFNEKEIGNSKQALRYFIKAERYSRPGTKAKIRIENALAETYYINKNYRNAIKYYERNIKTINDKWWTKDAFNLAWSYFRVKRYSEAINLMKKVYRKSSDPNYVDMRSNIVKDIGLFYAESGKVEEGLAYFKSINKDFTAEMTSLAFFLKESGKYTQALTVLTEALKLNISNENKLKIHLARLDLFDKYDKSNAHLKDSIKIYRMMDKVKFNEQQKNDYTYQVKKQIAKLQKKINSKFYKKSKKLRNRKVKQTVGYLTILKKLEPGKNYQINFYKAETYFQSKEYAKSIDNYFSSIEENKNDDKIKKLSLEGSLAAIGVSKRAFPQRDSYVPKVYGKYLELSTDKKKNQEIRKRLFKFYYDKNDVAKMSSTLDEYAKYYPRDIIGQEKMVNSLLEKYRKQNNNTGIQAIVGKIEVGELKISKKGKKDLYGIYQKVEIRRLENQVKNKNFEEAILGYEKIYNNSKTSKIAKANAAYNLMVLNYKNFALKDTYKWSQKALTEMNNKDFLKYKSSFLGVSKYLFERMQFMASGDISHRSLGKICGVKDSLKDTYFLNSVIMYNVSDDHTKLKSLEKLAYQCKLSRNSINEFYKVYLNFLDRTKRYTVLTSYLDKLKNNTGIINDLIFLGGKAYDRSNFNSAKNKWKKFIRYVSGVATAKRILLQLKALDVIAKIELEKLVYVQNQLLNMKLRFPEKTYNSILGNMFVRLEKITDQSIKIQNIGSGDGISKSFDILIGSYQYVFKSINTFKPTNKSNEYIKSFQQSMSKILNPLRSKVIEYQRSFQSTIIKGDILSDVEMKSMDYAVRPVDEIKLISGQRMGKR